MFGGFSYAEEIKANKQAKKDTKHVAAKPLESQLAGLNLGDSASAKKPVSLTAPQEAGTDLSSSGTGKNGGNAGLQDHGELSRDQIAEFFTKGINLLRSTETRSQITAQAKAGERRLNECLVDAQAGLLEEMGIDRDFGQACLNQVPRRFNDDTELHRQMVEFSETCQETYITLLMGMKPDKLRETGKMTRDQIMEFFESTDALMSLPETKRTLAARAKELKGPPNQEIIEMQHEMLEALGWQREHGVRCLSEIPQDYGDDEGLLQRMQRFAMTANTACQEAVYGKEAMLRQQQARVKMMQRQQQAAAEVQAMSGREKKAFLRRMQPVAEAHMSIVGGLAQQERVKYISGMGEQESLDLAKLSLLVGGASGGGMGHGHSHAHGQECNGHDHATQEHSHSYGGQHGRSPASHEHSHDHGQCSGHGHGYSHSH